MAFLAHIHLLNSREVKAYNLSARRKKIAMVNNNKFSKVGIWAISGVMIGGIEGCAVYKNRL